MAETSQTVNADHLLNLLTQQRDLYQRLRELAEQQRALISSDRPENLLGVLRERQTLVSKLAQLNMQLAPFRRDWNGTYSQLDEEVRLKASTLLDEINGMLQLILRADREDSALLSARKQVVANELNEINGGKAANTAYAQQAQKSGDSTADLSA